MHLTWWSGVGAIALATIISWPGGAVVAQTGDVYSATLSLSAVTQNDGGPPPSIVKIKATTSGLVNLALGRDQNTPLGANETLALVVDCSNDDLNLIVYDKVANSNLVTIATMQQHSGVNDLKKGQFVAVLEVQAVGDFVHNSLNDGFLVLTGAYKIGTNDCANSIAANVTGVVDITITDDVGTHSGNVLAIKGKLKAGKTPIGTLGP